LGPSNADQDLRALDRNLGRWVRQPHRPGGDPDLRLRVGRRARRRTGRQLAVVEQRHPIAALLDAGDRHRRGRWRSTGAPYPRTAGRKCPARCPGHGLARTVPRYPCAPAGTARSSTTQPTTPSTHAPSGPPCLRWDVITWSPANAAKPPCASGAQASGEGVRDKPVWEVWTSVSL